MVNKLEELKMRHGQTMKHYLFAKGIHDRNIHAITPEVMIAIADYVAAQLVDEEPNGR